MSDFGGPSPQGHYVELELNSGLNFARLAQGGSAVGSHETYVDGQGALSSIRQEFILPPRPPYLYNTHGLQEPALFNYKEETGHGVTIGSAAVSKIRHSDEIDGSGFRGGDCDYTR